jgi:hypothetical protein
MHSSQSTVSRRSTERLIAKPSGIVPRLLTVRQASTYSGATVWAIRQLYWAKDIAGTIIGRRLLIDRESIDAFINRKLADRTS